MPVASPGLALNRASYARLAALRVLQSVGGSMFISITYTASVIASQWTGMEWRQHRFATSSLTQELECVSLVPDI